MRGGLGLLVVLAAFAAGVGLGFIVQGDGGGGGRTARTVVERPIEDAPRLDHARAQSLRELLDAIPIDAVPSGNGKVTGRVLTHEGKPLAGVEIVATPHRARVYPKGTRAPARQQEPDYAKMVEDQVRRVRWRREGMREATSGADGTFTVEGLGNSEYNFNAYAEGYAVRARNRSRVRAGGTVDFEARPVIRADVDVIVEGSGAPDRVMIMVTRRRGGGSSISSQQWTRKEPWIELGPGTFELRAELQGDLGGKSETQTVTVKAGEAELRLSFLVKVKPALRLAVNIPASLAGASVHGWALRVAGERTPTADELTENGIRQFGHQSAEAMLWKNLEPGRYLVGAAFNVRGRAGTTALVEVLSGLAEHSLDLPEPTGEGVLKVRILGPEGEVVTDAQWLLSRVWKGGTSSGSATSLRRTDGIHLLMTGREAVVEGGRHTLQASVKNWGHLTVDFDPASPEILEMRFAKPAEVTGRITGYRGCGYEGRLRTQWEDPQGRPMHVWFSGPALIDDDGRFPSEREQPGPRVLALYVSTGRNRWARIAEQPVSLRSGLQSVSIAMPALHKLRVVWGGEGRPTIGLRRLKRNKTRPFYSEHRQKKVGADGVALFDALTPDRFRVDVYNVATSPKTEVEIPAQSEIRLP